MGFDLKFGFYRIPVYSGFGLEVSLYIHSYITGDLKLVEKPSPLMLAPHDFCNIKANVKVASTENGIIFGNIGTYLKWHEIIGVWKVL